MLLIASKGLLHSRRKDGKESKESSLWLVPFVASTIMKIKMSTKMETRREWGDWDKEKRCMQREMETGISYGRTAVRTKMV